jgi:hypothetical protein
MKLLSRLTRSTLLLGTLLVGLAACNTTTDVEGELTGTYTATIFEITPEGESKIDVLAAGGSLQLIINDENRVTGQLVLPASIEGGINAPMIGTAIISGSTVNFEQTSDTFVRDLNWTRTGTSLTVENQIRNGTAYTVTLTRQ